MLFDKKHLKEKYKNLPRQEKEIIGTSLVKVNMGVSLPADQKRVAAFLKGSVFIAKPESLDELIQYFHDEKEVVKAEKQVSLQAEHSKDATDNKGLMDGLAEYDEDGEPTVKSAKHEIKN